MSEKLRVALVGGPMYDALYEGFRDDVEVVVQADHLSLNERVAEMLSAGERIDVLSTHGKYAPSQRQWLHPLDNLLASSTIAALEAGAVALCRDRGDLLCAPRNIDVRVLWWRSDRMDSPPDQWSDLINSDGPNAATLFGFTGRGSGLFGLFFELVVGAGGALFADAPNSPSGWMPALDQPLARSAIETIATLAGRCPSGSNGITSWHYDEADKALCDGTVDAGASWPGATTEVRASAAGEFLRPAPYPAGDVRRVSYSGCHGWAIPKTCGDLDRAVELVERLCSAEYHSVEASLGGIPARTDVLNGIEPIDDIDAQRLDATRRTIADAMITYPALERFPQLEDRGAAALTAVLSGDGTIDTAIEVINAELAAVAGTA